MKHNDKLWTVTALTVAVAALSAAAPAANARVMIIEPPGFGGSNPVPQPPSPSPQPPAPPPPAAPSLSIEDVSLIEGDAGTSTMVFRVSLSAVISGGLTIDLATIANTAGAGDFSPRSLSNVTFGDTAANLFVDFAVDITGDTTIEDSETFFVGVSNLRFANSTIDATLFATGTILNDDGATAAVPEPATGLLVGGSLLALAWTRQRARRRIGLPKARA